MRSRTAPSRLLSSRPKGLRYARRPCLEALEDRIAPASLISISNSSLEVNGTGAADMDFTVTRSGDLGPQVVVAYSTSDGTAKAGTDYTPTSGDVTIAAGSATATIVVPVTNQFLFETSRSFSVYLTSVISVSTIPTNFAAATNFALVNDPRSVAIGDLNGDGKPDLAVANYNSGTVSVLLNTTAPGSTTPTFSVPATFAVGSDPVFRGDRRPERGWQARPRRRQLRLEQRVGAVEHDGAGFDHAHVLRPGHLRRRVGTRFRGDRRT